MDFINVSDFTTHIRQLLKKHKLLLNSSYIYININKCDIFFTEHSFKRLEARFSNYSFDWVTKGIIKTTKSIKKFRKCGKKTKTVYTSQSMYDPYVWVGRYKRIRHVYNNVDIIPFNKEIILFDPLNDILVPVVDYTEKLILVTLYYDSYVK